MNKNDTEQMKDNEFLESIKQKIEFLKEEIQKIENEIAKSDDLIHYGTKLSHYQPILVSNDKIEWGKTLFDYWGNISDVITINGAYKYAKYDREAIASNWLPNNGNPPKAKKTLIRLNNNNLRIYHPEFLDWSTSDNKDSIKEYMVIE